MAIGRPLDRYGRLVRELGPAAKHRPPKAAHCSKRTYWATLAHPPGLTIRTLNNELEKPHVAVSIFLGFTLGYGHGDMVAGRRRALACLRLERRLHSSSVEAHLAGAQSAPDRRRAAAMGRGPRHLRPVDPGPRFGA